MGLRYRALAPEKNMSVRLKPLVDAIAKTIVLILLSALAVIGMSAFVTWGEGTFGSRDFYFYCEMGLFVVGGFVACVYLLYDDTRP